MSTTHTFEIESEEGLPIRGTLELPARPQRLAVVIHGFKGFSQWGFFPWLTGRLCEADIAACRFDMSRSGIGEDSESFERLDLFADDTYSIQLSDLERVVAHLRSEPSLGALPLFLMGHSRGGAIALLASRRIRNLRGIVTWSAVAALNRWDEETTKTWRAQGHLDVINARTRQVMRMSTAVLDDLESNRAELDVMDAVTESDVPLLLVHGGSDETVDPAEAYTIAEANRQASVVVIAGASHTFNAIHPLVTVPAELELAAHVTTRFIATYR
jgi:uncharacterized protein